MLAAALVAAVVWLRNVGAEGEFRRYAIHFEHQAVDGLEIGADVTLRGLRVGRVEEYKRARDKVNRVRVEVRVDHRAPVHQNTVAVITRNFVTGIASIALITPEPAAELLTKAPEGERLPLIGEGRSDLDEIAGRVSKVGEMAAVALNNFNELLSPDNRAAVTQTVRNLRDLTGALQQRLGKLDETLERFASAADGIRGASGELARTGDRIASVAERGGAGVERSLAELDRTLAEARAALKAATQATGDVQEQVARSARRIEDSAASVDDQLGAAVGELRLSVEAATRAVDKARTKIGAEPQDSDIAAYETALDDLAAELVQAHRLSRVAELEDVHGELDAQLDSVRRPSPALTKVAADANAAKQRVAGGTPEETHIAAYRTALESYKRELDAAPVARRGGPISIPSKQPIEKVDSSTTCHPKDPMCFKLPGLN